MNDSVRLEIKVLSDSVTAANARLDKLAATGGKAERATDGLTNSFKSLVAPLLATVSAVGALNKLVEVTREFDKLNAGLITATGSSEKAAIAFEALQQFASQTPYDLGQAVDGFTKLVNLGLTPSEAALMSYGNTASAMGKDLNQMIEAVADASTGEFERLKEFGIKAKKEGDQVSLTFQGVTTNIGNNAAEIEGYLIGLGQNQFAGAMEARMDSLDGAMSNLGDAWDQLFLKVSQSGVGDVIESAVRTATAAIEELTAMVASGELEGYLTAIGGKFDTWGQDVQDTIRILTDFYKDNLSQFETEGTSTVTFLINAFKQFPENVRAFIQIAVVEIASFFDRLIAQGRYAKDSIAAIFNDDSIEAAGQRYANAMAASNTARAESIAEILKERDTSLESYDRQMAAAKALREEYDKAQAAKAAQTGDRLAGFKVGGTGAAEGESDDGGDAKASAKAQKEADRLAAKQARLDEAQAREFQSVVDGLMSQEEAIQASYERRMAIVVNNTEAESTVRQELVDKLNAQRDEALKAEEESQQAKIDALYNGLLTEEEMLLQSYERRRQAILDSDAITAEQRLELMSRLEEQYSNEQAAAETKRIQTQLAGAQNLFNGLAGLAKAYGGEQSKAYRALFAVSKAFSVAQAAMSIATGLGKAQELGFPANLAEMARVAATGAGILSTIQGSNFSGAYDKGGNIPAGKIGLVGEYGPELMEGPARITSRAETAKMFKEGGEASAPAAPPQVNIRQINAFDTGVIGDYLGSDAGEEVILNVIRRNPEYVQAAEG